MSWPAIIYAVIVLLLIGSKLKDLKDWSDWAGMALIVAIFFGLPWWGGFFG